MTLNHNSPSRHARRWLEMLTPAFPVVALSASLAADAPDQVQKDAATPGSSTNTAATSLSPEVPEQKWNLHGQITGVVEGAPPFPAKYSGPNSLNNNGEVQETVSFDVFAGVRLWRGAEAHFDGLVWQGFGLSGTHGIEAFPSGEAYRLGTEIPNATVARIYLQQTINLGGDSETVADDQLHLAGTRDVSRLTLTVGQISVLDIFDYNTYAHDPTTQFMNWAFVANEAWDYPANSLGYISGFAAELNQPVWALRYGFFQVPENANGMAIDDHYLEAWAMATEAEGRYHINGHPGAIRFLAYLNQAHMGSYAEALTVPGVNIDATREYRQKYGFALNWEQEITTNIGVFSRLGWGNGTTEAWMYSDEDRMASAGVSVKGGGWNRPDDTYGLAAAVSGITHVHQEFFAAGGLGILAGDGALNYGLETAMETYYDARIWKALHGALDYQFVSNPAYNRDRGPVSVIGARLHWEF